MTSAAPDTGEWADELAELARAVAGGMLFGIPLLYTMEMWWIGSWSTPQRSLALLVICYAALVVLHRTAGFRRTRDVSWSEAAGDAAEALAIGIVLTAVMLVLLREITGMTTLAVSVGKIVHQALPFSVGVGVSRFVLSGSRDDTSEGDDDDDGDGEQAGGGLADLGVTTIGALLVAAAIAPTDEVDLLAAASSPPWILGLLAASLVLSYAIVFVAGFDGQDERHEHVGWTQHPLTETVVCYLLALLCSGLLLWAFGRLDGPAAHAFNQAVILGLPASIGGAAGRLAI